jgi:23S rRNA pseudouridine2605 synthase
LTGLNNSKHFGLARAINKAGFASRSKAEQLVSQGHVSWNGRIVRDPEWGTTEGDAILVDGQPLAAERKIYLMCHKPKGLVTTADDNKGRPTVFQCLEGLDLPHVGPVGRLDMASEGLRLFTNDTQWAAALLDPANRVPKTYHVQIDGAIDEAMMELMTEGVVDAGEKLQAISVQILREGEKNRWIEIVSPGNLPNNLTVEKIRAGNSNLRNPILVGRLRRIGPAKNGRWEVLQ